MAQTGFYSGSSTNENKEKVKASFYAEQPIVEAQPPPSDPVPPTSETPPASVPLEGDPQTSFYATAPDTGPAEDQNPTTPVAEALRNTSFYQNGIPEEAFQRLELALGTFYLQPNPVDYIAHPISLLALQEGAVYYNTQLDTLRTFDGVLWSSVGGGAGGGTARLIFTYAAETTGTTLFAGIDDFGNVLAYDIDKRPNVWLNGVLLFPEDYTADNGLTVVLAVGIEVGGEVMIETFSG